MLHPPQSNKKQKYILFRNDDVSFDTELHYFKRFCETFHKAGFIQLHGVVIYGLCNYRFIKDGYPWIYNSITRDEYHDYEKCVKASEHYYIGDNKNLIRYLNSIPDKIALHGLYHTDYSVMTYEQQEHDIREGLNHLSKLFPNKKIDTFIPPFNKANEVTYQVCERYDLRVSTLEGEHFEDRIDQDKGPLYEGEVYRYHHHRFYPSTTFNTYYLSVERLRDYFKKYSYTFNERVYTYRPSIELKKICCGKHFGANKKLLTDKCEILITRYVNKDEKVLIYNFGGSDIVDSLWFEGFKKIYCIEEDDDEKNTIEYLNHLLERDVVCSSNIKDIPQFDKGIGGFLYVTEIVDIAQLDELFAKFTILAGELSYWIIMLDTAYEDELIDKALEFNAMLLDKEGVEDGNSSLYVFIRRRPKVCLYCDTRNWAHDHSAKEIKRYLSDEFEMDIRYVVDRELVEVDSYDAFLVFWWGEDFYKWKRYSKSRIIKQVSSHRWQYDKPYGPIGSEQFGEQYLNDAYTVICPSKILYDELKNVCKNLFLCGKGYSPDIFKYTSRRDGEISFCMAGNIKDPVKGVYDILKPACEGYALDIVSDKSHEELNDFYNKHDVYVVSSLHEADPLPLIESMACGCFPISSRIGIAPELIRHKENGYLVENRTVEDFRKAVEWCADHLDFIRSQADTIAKETYENRRWEIKSEAYRKMLRDHIKRR